MRGPFVQYVDKLLGIAVWQPQLSAVDRMQVVESAVVRAPLGLQARKLTPLGAKTFGSKQIGCGQAVIANYNARAAPIQKTCQAHDCVDQRKQRDRPNLAATGCPLDAVIVAQHQRSTGGQVIESCGRCPGSGNQKDTAEAAHERVLPIYDAIWRAPRVYAAQQS